MENNLMVYQSVITDIKNIINAGQQEAYGAASKANQERQIRAG